MAVMTTPGRLSRCPSRSCRETGLAVGATWAALRHMKVGLKNCSLLGWTGW